MSALLAYAANSITPQLVADFKDGVYGKNSGISTFDNVLNHTRNSNATMVDADGALKWAPHNFVTQSEDLNGSDWSKNSNGNGVTPVVTSDYATGPYQNTNADRVQLDIGTLGNSGDNSNIAISVPDAFQTTRALWVRSTDGVSSCVITLELTGSSHQVTVTGDWQLLSVPSDFNSNFEIGLRGSYSPQTYADVLIWGVHVYRSDLGGMVNNPATGDSYVPTTDAARYLPRENHHVYNGSAWVKEGYLHEPETATNLITYSRDFTDASWTKDGASVSANTVVSPDGSTNGSTVTGAGGANLRIRATLGLVNGSTYVFSAFVKQGTSPTIKSDFINVQSGPTFTWSTLSWSAHSSFSTFVVNEGGGWYRIGWSRECNTTSAGPSVIVSENGATVFVYGTQFEEGSVPTSYIPTVGSTVTRAADTLTLPVANIPYPEPVVIGPELVTNGDFATGDFTGWDASAAWSVDDREAVGNDTSSSNNFLRWLTGAEAGKVFLGSVEVVSNDGVGSTYIEFGGSVRYFSPSPGVYTTVFTGGSELFRSNVNGTNTNLVIDNLSVREINPLAVSIGYKALVTFADTDDPDELKTYDWRADSSNSVYSRIRTNQGTGQVQFRQDVEDVVNTVETGGSVYTPNINVPMSIASRHGSTFINGAVDGTALTANTTPTAFPGLSTSDLLIAPQGGPQIIQSFIMWGGTTGDIGDTGIAETSA